MYFFKLFIFTFCSLHLFWFIKVVDYIHFKPLTSVTQRNIATSVFRDNMKERDRQEGMTHMEFKWVKQSDIATSLKKSVLLVTDNEFVEHSGFDFSKKDKWTIDDIEECKNFRKDSRYKPATITQNVVRGYFLSGESNLDLVIIRTEDLFLVTSLELFISKRKLYELYLNNAEWGYGIVGIQAAAHYYFEKNAKELNEDESAALAVILLDTEASQEKVKGSLFKGCANKVKKLATNVIIPTIPD